ncbi:MAG: carbamoyl-phosphate synthase large subunit [Chthoniobacter sp.]|jgi:carbamoyl-phosphate synthase large subunit|nr:carbamoyl-phosphate synthase large subunit [Chthoniobacter sp.]
MPKDPSLHKILLIGSGPIVIGQGCEFDYSGVQACKALKEEGYTVILVNSNPATIMTDPEFAHRTYIEPITPEVVEKIIEREKPDALLPTLGGQTALNCAMKLFESGVLEKYGVKMIGANAAAIHKGEDRQAFKDAMIKIGLDMPRSGTAHTMEEGRKVLAELGTLPLIIRPAFTLGGSGGGIAYNKEEFETIVARGLDLSPVSEVLIEESLLGWKEFEMEVMRDRADNCVIVCSIENVDPMGVHTGDSITVAPIQTLTDREFQVMRDASFAIIREIGVETGGSNIQFAVNPDNGRMIVIEMNPRVSRSSALASKATGFPIAKIAAKLAVGYTLDEVRNDITRETPASFEPTIDYVVVKVPRFTFEKFPQADPVLTTQMKSVGEAMAIGRTFKEALQKALRSLEIKRFGLIGDGADKVVDDDTLRTKLTVPNEARIFCLGLAFQRGWTVEEIFEMTKIDRWFLENIREIVSSYPKSSQDDPLFTWIGMQDSDPKLPSFTDQRAALHRAKKLGFSDRQIAVATGTSDAEIRANRKSASIQPTYRLVDTCAAEFEAYTPYYYSTYGDENERRDSGKKKVIILGGGPNRIGQGIEFDYCCVHAAFALREEGFETIMVNSNPETVSTDYDTSDKLYFEPLTLEDVLNICEQESENLFGVIVQFGGQTPLNLAAGLQAAGVPIIGTSPQSIEIAEDRKLFGAMLDKLGIRQTSGGTAVTEDEAAAVALRVGYPVLVRPSFVLGGRGMQLVHNEVDLRRYVREAIEGSAGFQPAASDFQPGALSRADEAPDPMSGASREEGTARQDAGPSGLEARAPQALSTPQSLSAAKAPQAPRTTHPVLVDHFLEDALEVDVDCISDGETVVIGAIMEHIEEAGIHSGDSACAIPPFSLKEEVKAEIAKATKAMALELKVKGLMNVQFAVKDDVVYVLEVNPRASRTAPFVSKAIGVPLPKLAAKIIAGKTLQELGFTQEIVPKHFSVKEAVFPFIRFPGIDIMLGPEMKSTGEVMGIDQNLGLAYAKAQMAAQPALPNQGNLFISLADRQKPKSIEIARGFADLGFKLYATSGTAAALKAAGIPVKKLFKLNEGRPNALDMIKNGELALIINTPSGKVAREDEVKIRSTATANRIPIITTLRAAKASLDGIRALRTHGLSVKSLQEYHG